MSKEPETTTSMKLLMVVFLWVFFIIPTTNAYLLVVDETLQPGDVIFNASVSRLGWERFYSINLKRSAPFVNSLIHVNSKTGQVSLLEGLQCDGFYYPNLFTVYIDSTSNEIKDIEYYSLPLRIFIVGKNCGEYNFEENDFDEENTKSRRSLDFLKPQQKNKIEEIRQWVSETYASFAIPTTGSWEKICLKQSQYINSIAAFQPETISTFCKVHYHFVSDERFKIEQSQGDLVASKNTCIVEPLWKVSILYTTICNDKVRLINSEHRLKIVYHHQKFNDTDIARRVRRELRNQSPFFEQHLYLASVLEECDPGVQVTTVKARDPENSPITYTMTSLLDSRTQAMFDIDPKTGIVTTKVKLDRELIDVHYFRVTAMDDTFPPRTGTTMLQINVLDANDHSPVFEMTEYDASVRESVTVGTTVITLKATDQDIGKNSDVEYAIQSINGGGTTNEDEDKNAFKIDSKTGVITTRTMLDRETSEVYTLIVTATDQATPQNNRRSSSASVVVQILDDNDNYPQFSERTYTISLNEDVNWADNPVIAHIKATDADQGTNAQIRYAVINGNTQSQFSIDSLTGDVTLVKPLDYETIRNYRLVIRAQDGGSPARSNTTQLLINIKDVNDNAPRFYTSLFQESVLENVEIGFSIVRVQAYDADEGLNAEIKYSIAPRDATGGSTEDLPLTVDPSTGWIKTIRELDREDQSKFMFQVIASDQGLIPQSASASVILTVQDVNDNDPIFEPKLYEALIAEDDPLGTPVATVTASDKDEDARLHYEITGGNLRGRFAITSQNGRGLITVAQPLDYKQEKRFVLTVTASDSGGRVDTATIYVNVTDANNFAPVFENAPYTTNVFEDAVIGTTVLVVSAQDNDVGVNAQITYSLGEESDQFTINPQTGAVITTKLLDREAIPGYLLTVTAKDGGNPSHSDTTDVEITVTDVNDNYPVFKQASYSGSVLEDALIGTSVVQVSATDADVGLNGRIRFTLSEKDQEDGSFVIDPTSGVIRTNKGLDRESVALYELEAYAIDRGSPTLSSSVPVSIKIEDINDSPPAFDSDKITLYIPENSPVGSTVGEIYAKDPDEGVNALVQYSIIGGEDSERFSLVTRPGSDKAELLTMIELDYESSKKKYDLIVRASSAPLRNDAHVEIIVTDVNDNAPQLKDFQVMFNNFRDCFPTGPIGRVPAFDADVSDKLQYTILSGNNANLVALNESSGKLQLSPQLNTNVPKVASMEISVTDGVNEVKALMQLSVRLITEEMLFNSITVRLNQMTKEAFLSPLLTYFLDALAAILPCPKENIFIFSIQDDTDVQTKILNVSFSVKRPDVTKEQFYSPQYLKEKVYLNRGILARLATVQILAFEDNLCVREPCINFEECLTVLRFGNASGFISSDTVLFRPIYPVTTFTCRCPLGFTGSKEHYLCDTEVNLCYSSPCKNNGTCHVKEGGYTCVCPMGFTGDDCEVKLETNKKCKTKNCNGLEKSCFVKQSCEECFLNANNYNGQCQLKSRSFKKRSFMTFPSLKQRHRLRITLKFATQSPNGLLFYNGRYNEQHDFISLEIIEKKVQFSFSLGNKVSRVTASIPGGVSDGNWHSVIVEYFNKTATISLDNCDVALAFKHGQDLGPKWLCADFIEHKLEERCSSLTETCHRFLDLTGPFQIGGLPALTGIFQVKNSFYEGCISDLEIDYKFIDLNSFTTDNGTTVGCPEKQNFCSAKPCRNGGECREGWGMFKCLCPEGLGGVDCSETIATSWHFSGDGTLSFNPLLRPIQLPWLNALSVRTLQDDTFLMSIQVGQNSSAVMSLSKGLLTYSYNGESLTLNSSLLTDGQWHKLEVTWLGTEIKLAVDYGEYSVVLPFLDKIQSLYVGRILIGGPDNTFSSLNAGYNYLEGCIQDVRIGNQQTSLTRPTVKENVEDGCYSLTECQKDCPSNSNCITTWGRSHCECLKGHVGPLCVPVCSVSPCEHGTCLQANNDKNYQCSCNSTGFTGEYCEKEEVRPCPASWWGFPVCGPCNCDISAGYNPDCNKTNGKCHCKENYYQPKSTGQCLPCDCYHIGSYSAQCDHETGQCHCREGVIGLKCNSCPNNYAEVTLKGCEVVYDGCPRSSSNNIWWPRTLFGEEAIQNCPKNSHGKASRSCDSDLGGWQEPNMFNCTSKKFLELREQLSKIEDGDLQLNSFVTIKLAHDLFKATNSTEKLFGADVLVTFTLLKELLGYEMRMNGLNLTHSQDKDYINNLVHAANEILVEKYSFHWTKIDELTGENGETLVLLLEKYINILSESQHDTYTSPFEIVSPNVVLGLDVVTTESLFGYETVNNGLQTEVTTEKIILPDTSSFLQENPLGKTQGPSVSFPKYNNFLLDPNKFDQNTKIVIPLTTLGIKPFQQGFTPSKLSQDQGAVISYAEYRQAGVLFSETYDESVVRRWGVAITLGTPLLSVSVLIPQIINPIQKTTEQNIIFEEIKLPDKKKPITLQDNEPVIFDRYKRHLNQKILYKNLAGVVLEQPVKLQMWLDSNKTIFNERSNPQCVHWTRRRGFGEWTRVGCRTELEENWFEKDLLFVNCSCNYLGTFAVLVDVVDLEYIPEPSLLENISSYSCFALSLPLLLATYLILALIRGLQTNSNTIRKNLVLCVFLAELLYFIALKLRKLTTNNEFFCKLIAIGLHYLWLGSFAWMLVDAIHLYRMLTEMRDINHGPMRFYYSIGYVVPAIVVSLSVGVRAHQYGNYYFCWVSLYESVIWSLVGPISLLVITNFLVLILSIRAAFTLQDHVLGFGNLRTLLWVSVVSLPLLGATWVLALLGASEQHPLLTPFLSGSVLIQAIFSLAGYCFANNRVRQNLIHSIMRCLGKKVPLLETQSVVGVPSTSSQNITGQSRSALAYHASLDPTRRNIGISTSSTTSRSTTKTSSSPYRSDTHLRHTSTSTSNYNSTSDVPSYLRSYEENTNLALKPEELRRTKKRDSDSDSEGSEGRSLDLASSHSSDDDESSTRRNRNRRQGYLPNITEHVVSRCGTPPSLNIVTKSQLFPQIPQQYGPRWSSQLPDSYLTNPQLPEIGRWSQETGSDNEFIHKSPNPLPNPEMGCETVLPQLQSEQYLMRAHYDFNNGFNKMENMNYQEFGGASDLEDKQHLSDKYLFPYTAEEDHVTMPHHHYLATSNNSSRIMSPITNDINNPGMDYHHSSRMGSVLGSVCGSIRGTPSPLVPPVSMSYSNHPAPPEPPQVDDDDKNEETSV